MYKVILATRYLLRRRITYFAVLAVALCVFIVVVVMTVMNGLVQDFKQKNHRFVGDCVVTSRSLVGFPYYEDFVRLLEGNRLIRAVSEVIQTYALLNPRGREVYRSVEVLGIDPVRHSRVTGFGDSLYYRRDEVSKAFEPSYDPNLPGCVLGIDLALPRGHDSKYVYEARPVRVGFSISFLPLTARGALAGAGAGLVNTRTFYYSDHSETGLARVDGAVVYLPFEQVQLLCGMAGPTKRVSAISVKFEPGVDLEAGCETVERLWNKFKSQSAHRAQAYLLDMVSVQSWKTNRRELIAAMEKEEAIMIVMFVFVGIVTVFIVLVVFYMVISHKSKDIGVLRSVGASGADIMGLFSGFAFLVGLVGGGIGVLGGWVFLLKINDLEDWLFERFGFQIWDRTLFAIGDIPNQVSARVVGVIVASAIAACLIGAAVPSWQAVRLRPVETLQVNQL